jgi:SAM-dependent methyltransferase
MGMFLRKTRLEREPLAVTMSGVRMGERVLQIGLDDARRIALIAAKSGLTGTAAIVVRDDAAAARVQQAIADAGALAEVHVVRGGELPFPNAAFDAIVVHETSQTVASPDASTRAHWLRECERLLRGGGRLVAIEPGEPHGLRSWLTGSGKGSGAAADSEGVAASLRAGGFPTVRLLGDREGLRFVEGLKSN